MNLSKMDSQIEKVSYLAPRVFFFLLEETF